MGEHAAEDLVGGRAPPWFHLEMALGPTWPHIARIRSSLLEYLTSVFCDQDYRDALTMVVTELLENAIKHGDWQRHPKALVRLRVRTDAKTGATVEVISPCSADSDSVARLLETVAQLEGGPNPREAYQLRLLEIARSEGRVTGLGLARVAYEGRCRLKVDMESERSVRVLAAFTPPESAAGQPRMFRSS